MIELSLGKLVLLALIALIVLGPEKLPGAARTAGALLRRLRSGWDDVRAEVERELEVEQIRLAAREAAAQAEAAHQEVKDGLHRVHEPLAAVVDQVAAVESKTTDPVITHAVPDEPVHDSPQAELPLAQPGSAESTPPTRNASHDHA
ncbi:MAG: Sec-independent protein translocase protein TatB [Rhodanobacter sp.]